jgi:uncharacterized protein YyaL (SSP411 family)
MALLVPIMALLVPMPGYPSTPETGEFAMPTPASLIEARQQKKGSYEVRTQYRDDGEPRYTNRLIFEDSPYLLQHAHNPVNWYAWGEEAFAEAQRLSKPVFLSIGYSTCHWCHVMEEESFDDERVAALLNREFIAIKVDREQRPDIDEIYMTGVQLLSDGGGGWPMSNFLTPQGKPFFGGTYYPRDQFMHLLEKVAQVWSTSHPAILDQADRLYAAIEQRLQARGDAGTVGQAEIDRAVQQLLAGEDKRHGGFRDAPKFPNESHLMLLLDQLERSDTSLHRDPRREALERALNGMLQGGIYDQVAGGFHRYATDQRWLVPHFEKMLYNQAQLARVYARAWRLTAEPEYRRVAVETLDYVLREMRSPQGGFYSATDADSEGEEGRYFVWTWPELTGLLNDRQLNLAVQVYGVSERGNFEGHNILYLPRPLDDVARANGYPDRETLLDELSALKGVLYAERQCRVAPLRDDKIITEWNGLMITALAEAGYLFDQPAYIEAAAEAAAYIWNSSDGGRLYRISSHGSRSTRATLEDYGAYLVAVLALYDATGDTRWLERAVALQQTMDTLFWNATGGGFFVSQSHGDGPVLLRSQSAMDGATASGNSLALVALVALNQRRSTPQLAAQIDQQISRYSAVMRTAPLALGAMLVGVAEYQRAAPRALQYAGDGHVRISAVLDRGVLVVTLSIDEGWHVNASDSGHRDLIDTRLTVHNAPVSTVQYPPGKAMTLSFSEQPLRIYEGDVRIVADSLADSGPVVASLRLQSCSDRLCLAPQTLQLVFH